MSEQFYEVTVEATVRIRVGDSAPDDLFARGMDPEFSSAYYGEMSRDDVLKHWAYNAVVNGVSTASRLDGWADLGRDDVDLYVVEAQADDVHELGARA